MIEPADVGEGFGSPEIIDDVIYPDDNRFGTLEGEPPSVKDTIDPVSLAVEALVESDLAEFVFVPEPLAPKIFRCAHNFCSTSFIEPELVTLVPVENVLDEDFAEGFAVIVVVVVVFVVVFIDDDEALLVVEACLF